MKTIFQQMHAINTCVNSCCQLFKMKIPASRCYLKPILTILTCAVISSAIKGQAERQWLMGGQNPQNTRNAITERIISPKTAPGLNVKWAFTTGGDVSATPAVENGFIYFPDWAGNLFKVNASTGIEVWKKQIKNYTGQTFCFARATPAIVGDVLIIGTQLGDPTIGARVLGISKITGDLLWSTQADDHMASIITQSAVVDLDRVYVGVASNEEGFANNPDYPCCSFRGSILCLNGTTGQIIWKTYMAPAGKGFSGNGVWGSTPVVDKKRNSLYITTGNNYSVPQQILDCAKAGGSPASVKACIMAVDGNAENHFDAFVALDLTTGAIKWANSVIPFDAWIGPCLFAGPNCPEIFGPDFDFAQGPALFSVGKGSNRKDLVGAGQKSGIYWALDPATGNEVWHTVVGPGSLLGGLQWGSAVDDKLIYTAVSNHDFHEWTMTTGPGAGKTIRGGFFSALNPTTGAITWEYAGVTPPNNFPVTGVLASNTGMVSVANGVVFAGALDQYGTMYAFDAASGQKLWSFESGGSICSGAAIVDGVVYWGSGYAKFGFGTSNNKLYAFDTKRRAARTAVATAPMTIIDQTKLAPISIYPSPANDRITIVSNDQSHILSINLFDLSGKLIKQFKPSLSTNFKLNLANIPNGTYMMQIITAANSLSTKIVVAH
ncbi:MAG: PQQ-binding-like beta-propeller repeat protein [Ferruginibacter sp.]